MSDNKLSGPDGLGEEDRSMVDLHTYGTSVLHIDGEGVATRIDPHDFFKEVDKSEGVG